MPNHLSSKGMLQAGAALALALVFLVLATPAGAAPVAGGQLDWGVKESFRNYIKGPIAHGQVTPSEGASENAGGTYRFPLAGGSADPVAASLAASGKVRFTGHDSGSGPLLDLTIWDLRVELAGSAGTLYADVLSKSLATGEVESFPDVAFAELDLSGIEPVAAEETLTWEAVPAVLTEDGAGAFAGFYAAGAELDPVTVTATLGAEEPEVPAEPQVPEPPAPSPPPAAAPPAAQPSASVPPRPQLVPLARARANDAGVATVARAACPGPGRCSLQVPRRVRATIAGKPFAARVIAPRKLAGGRQATVRVQLSRAGLAALGSGSASVRVPIVVRSSGEPARAVKRVAKVAVLAG